MAREVLTRIGRVAAFLAVLAVCVGAGWQAGRSIAPDGPAVAPEVPTGHVH